VSSGETSATKFGDLLGDAVDATAAESEDGADVEAERLATGVLLGDDRDHVGIGGVAARGHHDEAVAHVVVEVRHGGAHAVAFDERQHRHLDDLDRLATSVDGALGDTSVDVTDLLAIIEIGVRV
jgi:hypothetical protein